MIKLLETNLMIWSWQDCEFTYKYVNFQEISWFQEVLGPILLISRIFWDIFGHNCVPAWLNEALCGKTDYEAKIWAKVKIFHFWYISHHTKHKKHFFNENVEEKRCYGTFLQSLTVFWMISYLCCSWCSTLCNFW